MLRDVVRYANRRINKQETARQRQSAGKEAIDLSGDASPRVKTERELFNAKCFKGGGQGSHAGDAIGKLWLLGRLDVKGYDDTKLLSSARAWWLGRSEVLKDCAHKTARYERASRGQPSTKPTKAEKNYYHYERTLRDATDYDYEALCDLMEEQLGGSMSLWASRIVQTEVLRRLLHIDALVELACTHDYDLLAAAKRALIAMAANEARMDIAA